ncbi:MAG: hypothetical protein ACK5HO_09230 [Pseudomonadota bacterium]
MLNPQQSPTPQHLSYPNLALRTVELLTGSIRRDALHAIRTSSRSQWTLTESDSPTISVQTPTFHARFTFNAAQHLEILSLDSARNSVVLTGDCDMAQRLCRYADRRLMALFLQAKRQAHGFFGELTKDNRLPEKTTSTFACKKVFDQTPLEYTNGWIKSATFSGAFGLIELEAQHIHYEVCGERGREMLHDYISARAALDEIHFQAQRTAINVGNMGIPGMQNPYTDFERQFATYEQMPPPPAGVIKFALATFKNPTIGRMRALLLNSKDTPIVEGSSKLLINHEKIRAGLEIAERLAK